MSREMPGCRLLVVNHAVDMGGAERVLLGLLARLDREKFDPGLAVPHRGPLAERAESLGVRVHLGFPSSRLLQVRRKSLGRDRLAAAAYPWDMTWTVLGLRRLIIREGYELVLTNSAKADVYGSLAGWLARRPVVWRFHDIPDRATFSRLNLFLLRTSASFFASRILAISEAVREALADLGVPRDKIKVVYNGVEPQGEAKARRREKREEWGIPEDAFLVGMVGRLVEWKGPDVFLRAAALLSEAHPKARFVLVGDVIYGEREYLAKLKGLCASLGLEKKTLFTGFVDDPLAAMAALDCLVHASVEPEPFGMVLVEAMSLGLPVVAAGAGGVPEIVEDKLTGLLVPPGDFRALATALEWMISHPRERKEMGMRGKRRVSERFDLGFVCREMEAELLSALARGKGKRDG